jgi:hypothetical protein
MTASDAFALLRALRISRALPLLCYDVSMYTIEEAKNLTTQWLEELVIGMSLCPFAAPVVKAKQLRIHVSEVNDFDSAIRETLSEVSLLLNADPQEIATTLIVFTRALSLFDEFMEASDTLDELLLESKAAQIFQVATFHPQYQFANEPPESLSHYTNRAPLPIFHLLRVDDVSRAIDTHPDTLDIPRRNIEKLMQLGQEKVISTWKKFLP